MSQHCYLTRVAKGVKQFDISKDKWDIEPSSKDVFIPWDLAFSIAMFEHIPEDKLPNILKQLEVKTRRGLHGIDFGQADDGFDQSHVTLKPRVWWRQLFDAHGLQSHEIVDKEQLEKGVYPESLYQDNGKLKLNVGCCATMWHHGWINIDVLDMEGFAKAYNYKFLRHDVKNGLPCETGTVDALVAVHFLEHLTYREGLAFLRECRRVLKPETGVMRIQVPCANTLMSEHLEGYIHKFDEVNHNSSGFETSLVKLWSLLHSGHSSMYDVETLEAALENAGFIPLLSSFREVTTEPPYKSSFEMIQRETLDTHPALTLYMDAVPKLG